MMKSRDGSGVVQGGGGVADNRGGSNNGPVSSAVTSVDEGQSSTIGLTSGDLTQGVGLSLPLAIVDSVVKSGDSGGVVNRGGGIADHRGGGNRGAMGDHSDSSNTGDDSTVGLTSGDLVGGVGLSLPLAVVDIMMKSRDGSGVVQGGGGVADNRGGSNNGPVSGAVTSVDEGQGSTVGLTSGDLVGGVGLSISLPLSIEVVDTVVKGGDSIGVADHRGGIVEGDPADLGHASLGGVGDDTNIVKTTLSQGILSWGTSGHLSHSPGLGIPRDSHDGQAKNERFHG